MKSFFATSNDRFVDTLRAALKSSWDLRFGQYLLTLCGSPTGGLVWLKYSADEVFEEALRKTVRLGIDGLSANREIAARILSCAPDGAARGMARDVLVFLPLADAFCEALRVAKSDDPRMRYGEIIESAIAPDKGDREGQLYYQYREDSVRLLHRWSSRKAMLGA